MEAISRLKSVDLAETHLTSDQVQTIFYKIGNCENLKLTELEMCETDPDSVPADVLVLELSKLKGLNQRSTDTNRARELEIEEIKEETRRIEEYIWR